MKTITLNAAKKNIEKNADPGKAAVLSRFFKTGKGEYAEGDRFIGVTMPLIRRSARALTGAPERVIDGLLRSPIHEHRMTALVIMVEAFRKAEKKERDRIYRRYMSNTGHINNWDLVDISAGHIVGGYLFGKDRSPLIRLSLSEDLWERRIAIISTLYSIRKGKLQDTFALAEGLLSDKEDLIHKAVGWMLREAGKKDMNALKGFIKKHYGRMPRTTLRYAIERFPERTRKKYLKGAF